MAIKTKRRISIYPSVTQVLRPWSDFSRINPEVLEVAANRGQEVHAICSGIAKGLWVPDIPESCAGYVASFRQWFEQHVASVEFAEKELVDTTYGFQGHPDLLVTIKGDAGGMLLDLKTPRAPALSWRPQVAAYVHLARLNGYHVIRGGCLRLSPEGGPPILDEYTKTLNQDFNIFRCALTLHQYFS